MASVWASLNMFTFFLATSVAIWSLFKLLKPLDLTPWCPVSVWPNELLYCTTPPLFTGFLSSLLFMKLCFQEDLAGRGYQQGLVREELSGRSYQGGAVRKEISGKSCQKSNISTELSRKRYQWGTVRKEISVVSCQKKRYQKSCQKRDISEELSGKRYQWGDVRKKTT